MSNPRSPLPLRYLLAGLWAVLTVSLASWWVIFSLQQIERAAQLSSEASHDLVRYQKMLLWEGAFLLLLLIGGAAILAWTMYRELRETRRTQQFFAAFTHEIKTPIASLQLQAEILTEQMEDRVMAERFGADLARLTLQLDNSLLLASARDAQLHLQQLDFERVLSRVAGHLPNLTLAMPQSISVYADERALSTVLGNIVQNALVHGQASTLSVSAESQGDGTLRITLRDNGLGFKGERSKLGALFHRHYPGSGSGIGLHLSRVLMHRMNGQLELPETARGFAVTLILPGALR